MSDANDLDDPAALNFLCTNNAQDPPPPEARHYHVQLENLGLRWERHTEFITYTWGLGSDSSDEEALRLMSGLRPGGHLLVAVELRLRNAADPLALEEGLDPSSLALSTVCGGAAIVATDFRQDGRGLIQVRVANVNLSDFEAGALVQRLLELETYRVLAMIGLFEAHRVAPAVDRIEGSLARLVPAIREDTSHARNEQVLNDLVSLSASLETECIVSQYRFAATKAYFDIVQGRTTVIAEAHCGSRSTIAESLGRRLAPAMRTCTTMERRQADLASKLARTAELLRTRISCEMESQSRDLLSSMNKRTHSQLRLQTTVERLSIVVISYYVVALLSYLFAGLRDAGLGGNPSLATAASIPVVLPLVAIVARVLHRKSAKAE